MTFVFWAEISPEETCTSPCFIDWTSLIKWEEIQEHNNFLLKFNRHTHVKNFVPATSNSATHFKLDIRVCLCITLHTVGSVFTCSVLFLRKFFINLSFSLCFLGFFWLWEFGPFKLLTPCLKLTLFTAMEGMANNRFWEGLWGGTFCCLRGKLMLSSFWTKCMLSNKFRHCPEDRTPLGSGNHCECLCSNSCTLCTVLYCKAGLEDTKKKENCIHLVD